MAIPQQVQDRADKAEELQKTLMNPVDPAAAPANPDNPDNPAIPKEPAAAIPAEPTETLETLMPKYEALLAQEQRFKTLQGMFNKKVQEEVDRQLTDAIRKERILNNDLSERDRKIEALKAELEKMKAQSPDVSAESLFDPEELEVLNDEGLSQKALAILGKKMKQTSTAATAPVVETVKRSTADARAEKTSRFYMRLGQAVPDWEHINDSMQDWHAYLAQRVPGTNYKRQAIIDAAQDALDPTDIINLLNDFKALHPTLFPAAPSNTPAKTNMEKQVETIVPDTTTSRTPSTPGKIWTAKEVSLTLTEIANRKGRGGQADIDLEKDIEKAYAEGRVSQ